MNIFFRCLQTFRKVYGAAWTAEDEGVLQTDCLLGIKGVEGDTAPECVLMGTRSSHLAVSKGRAGLYRNKDEHSKCKNECFVQARQEKFVGLLIRGTVVKGLPITSGQGLTVGSYLRHLWLGQSE
jgi:hypothetical protein